MDDLISRQSLYDKMREAEELAQKRVIDTRKTSSDGSINPIYAIYKTQLNERTRFKEMIYDEPSAERKKGKWVVKEEDWRKQQSWNECSECGFATSSQYKFCPDCGADMGEGKKEYNGGQGNG